MKNFEYWEAERTDVSVLIGKVLSDIIVENNEIGLFTEDGEEYRMLHIQDCCEGVYIDDINGDWNDLIGNPILISEEVSNSDFEDTWNSSFNQISDWGEKKSEENGYYPESHTWTFYNFATIKGHVSLRWFGGSNGYYSESVDFYKLTNNGTKTI